MQSQSSCLLYSNSKMVPEEGLEPSGFSSEDFKSSVFANFTTPGDFIS